MSWISKPIKLFDSQSYTTWGCWNIEWRHATFPNSPKLLIPAPVQTVKKTFTLAMSCCASKNFVWEKLLAYFSISSFLFPPFNADGRIFYFGKESFPFLSVSVQNPKPFLILNQLSLISFVCKKSSHFSLAFFTNFPFIISSPNYVRSSSLSLYSSSFD